MSEETQKTEQFETEEQQDIMLDPDDLEQVSGGEDNNPGKKAVKKGIVLPVIKMK